MVPCYFSAVAILYHSNLLNLIMAGMGSGRHLETGMAGLNINFLIWWNLSKSVL